MFQKKSFIFTKHLTRALQQKHYKICLSFDKETRYIKSMRRKYLATIISSALAFSTLLHAEDETATTPQPPASELENPVVGASAIESTETAKSDRLKTIGIVIGAAALVTVLLLVVSSNMGEKSSD